MREKFPQAHGMQSPAKQDLPGEAFFHSSRFPGGKVSEVIPAGPGAGLTLLMAGLLGEPAEGAPHPELVLVDGAGSFDPASFTGAACSKMLWVRCSNAMEMVRAADLLVHDGNLPLVLLDTTGVDRRELTRLPASVWWRLNRTVEATGARLVVLTLLPLVPCASLRLSLSADLTLRNFDDSRSELIERVRAVPERMRHAT